MKLFVIRSAAAAVLLSLLSACGGSAVEAPTPAADAVALARPVMEAPGAEGALAIQPPPSNDQVPSPDCQPENCQGLRIIDGNAEAYRLDAMSRGAAADSST